MRVLFAGIAMSLAWCQAACQASAPMQPMAVGSPAHDAGPPSEPTPTRELVVLDNRHWQTYPAELDPLRAHQPPEIDCDPPAWQLELERLEVDTGACNYVLLEHPALVDVPQDSRLQLSIYYFDLTAPEPAEAHVAVAFGPAPQWETLIPIPRPGDALEVEFRSDRPLARGEPIRLHLHNHGRNNWLIGSMHALISSPAGRQR